MRLNGRETINCLTDFVRVDAQRSLGGLQIPDTYSLQEAKREYAKSRTPTRLPPGSYILVKHDDQIALLEPIQISHWIPNVYWIAETKNLLPFLSPIYSKDLPIIVENQDLSACMFITMRRTSPLDCGAT